MRQEINEMVNNGVSIERLSRQVANDKDAYTAYVRKGEEARAAQGLNLNKILNVSLAQAPTAPMMPVFPIIWLNFLAGAGRSICAATVAAAWEEPRGPRTPSTPAAPKARRSTHAGRPLHRDEKAHV